MYSSSGELYGTMGGNSNQTNNGLTPNGVNGGLAPEQKQLFQQAAQDSGLAGIGMSMLDKATGGMSNENQVQNVLQPYGNSPKRSISFLPTLPTIHQGNIRSIPINCPARVVWHVLF